nr:MAG TPA: hypothetical protein [Caudoviricetes sp.]
MLVTFPLISAPADGIKRTEIEVNWLLDNKCSR